MAKNVLIIGGSSGIGAAARDLLTEQGHNVYYTYNTHKPENSNQAQQFDVMNEEFSAEWLPDVLNSIVYCPGSIQLLPFSRVKKSSLLEDFNLHVYGAVDCIQKALPKLKASGNASIVLFSTVAVRNGFNFHTQVAMCKGAIEGLTTSLAAELAPTIRVNCIAPSITHTSLAEKLLNTPEKVEANAQRHPLRKIGQPSDIAHAVSFLINESSAWMSGQIMPIDGGISNLKI